MTIRDLAKTITFWEWRTMAGGNVASASSVAYWPEWLVGGSLLGGLLALLTSRVGLLFLLHHLARTTLWRVSLVTVKGVVLGATVGAAIELLRQTMRAQVKLPLLADWPVTAHCPPLTDERVAQDSASVADPQLALMVARYGHEHQSFLLLYGAAKVWWLHDPEAAIVYQQLGRVVVITAAPLTAPEHLAEVLAQFLTFCRAQTLDCLMLPIGPLTAAAAEQCGMGLLSIGESGYFRLSDWKPAGDRGKKVRAGVNQARKVGITVTPYEPYVDLAMQREIKKLCRLWLGTREVDALSWLLELDPFKLSEHKRYFLARDAEGRLEGFLACSPIPARQGWYLEDLLKRPGAERGVSELLVVEALKHLAGEGAQLATLGTSPLAGDQPARRFKATAAILRLIYQHLELFYHFRTLHRFKAKFAPSFIEPEYIAIYPPRIRMRQVRAVIRLFEPNGLSGLIASKWRRFLQRESQLD